MKNTTREYIVELTRTYLRDYNSNWASMPQSIKDKLIELHQAYLERLG